MAGGSQTIILRGMPEVTEVWSGLLPEIRSSVTGVGVWTALNTARPVAFEDGMFVIGLPHGDGELAGHLRVMTTKRLIESLISKKVGSNVTLRVIDGVDTVDWEAQQRKDLQAKKLQEQQMAKMRAEMDARTSWESIYEQLSRRYAAIQNKSLPQNRARFYSEAVELVAEARKNHDSFDELGERNFARCLERVSQYTEIPSTIVASDVLQRAGEI